jgi:excisionase family DNA binding protein
VGFVRKAVPSERYAPTARNSDQQRALTNEAKPSINKDKELLTSKDVAETLGCTPDEVNVLARTGGIRAIKQGRCWRFWSKDIMAFKKQMGKEG